MRSSRVETAFQAIDAANSADPNAEQYEGKAYPKELLYGRRMSVWMDALRPDAPEALEIAARAQHICRWEIPRDSFPMDRKGYLMWRKKLYTWHADKAAAILRDLAFDEETVERVMFLLQKRQLNTDPDTQSLEDAACLVFLQFHFNAFAAEKEEEMMIPIIRKTWQKMSADGHAHALLLDFAPEDFALIQRALAAEPA
ncbi:MAG: DUF4202 domain-containing protein [Candidatus Hydrogenedentes bacterium]|nr:DUF4202 domain-containing protein [Candidatus Hydrogenedentota bacterium]